MLAEYQKENQELLSELNKVISENDRKGAELMIHKLKSSSGSIGSKQIYDYCVKFQKVLQDGEDMDILIYKNEFSNLFQRLQKEIQFYIQK